LDEYISKRIDDIELDKLPSILIHFIYGQIVLANMKIFKLASSRLKGNMRRFSAKQLAQTVYSLSRINYSLVGSIVDEGVQEFARKSDESGEELSQERVTVLWSCSNSGYVDVDLYRKMLAKEIQFIPGYNDRTFVKLIHSFSTIAVELPLPVMKRFLQEIYLFLQSQGK
jgi:hypothetical protein